MSSHPNSHIRVKKLCLHCGKQIPGRGGLFCLDAKCQEARIKRKKATEKAWVLAHKPWRKRNKQVKAEPKEKPAKKLRYCQYHYCKRKKVALPEGWRFYHPDCWARLCEIYGRGITTELGI